MLRFVRSWSAISRSLPQFAPAQRPQSRRLLTLERLEDRALLSNIPLVVNSLANSGVGTLRDAIAQADTHTANQYVIKFSVPVPGTIDLTSALPDLSNNITIKGPGASDLTVQRDSSPSTPLFSVFTVDSGVTVSLSGMTITGGSLGHTGNGGGIDNDGTLTVNDSIFADNFTDVDGGGIYNSGMLIVTSSTFTGNTATIGGGIANSGTLMVTISVPDWLKMPPLP